MQEIEMKCWALTQLRRNNWIQNIWARKNTKDNLINFEQIYLSYIYLILVHI